MNRVEHLINFSRSRSRLSHTFLAALVCLGCVTQFEWPQSTAPDLEVTQWGVIESGRMADWAAQLPVGEAKREGIIGIAIV